MLRRSVVVCWGQVRERLGLSARRSEGRQAHPHCSELPVERLRCGIRGNSQGFRTAGLSAPLSEPRRPAPKPLRSLPGVIGNAARHCSESPRRARSRRSPVRRHIRERWARSARLACEAQKGRATSKLCQTTGVSAAANDDATNAQGKRSVLFSSCGWVRRVID